MELCERIIVRLGELNWTQKELARRVGVNQSSIAHICRGSQPGSAQLLKRIAAELDLDPDLLLVESASLRRPGSMHHKLAMAVAKKRGWSLSASGELVS